MEMENWLLGRFMTVWVVSRFSTIIAWGKNRGKNERIGCLSVPEIAWMRHTSFIRCIFDGVLGLDRIQNRSENRHAVSCETTSIYHWMGISRSQKRGCATAIVEFTMMWWFWTVRVELRWVGGYPLEMWMIFLIEIVEVDGSQNDFDRSGNQYS